MTSSPSSLRIAIVGAGPAGCFTAEELLRSGRACAITIYERLDRPFGLVRFGVAPDHPHTRRMIKLLERTVAAVDMRIGIAVGRDVSIDELRRSYDAVVLATGAEEDRTLNVPGEHLPGVHSSLSFAGWINGHPDYTATPFRFDTPTAVVIGNGNVALDLARLLCRSPEELRATDAHPAAIDLLQRSQIRTIHVIGRRGPAQASFGENELAEFTALPGIALRVDPIVTMPSPADEQELAAPEAGRARAVVATLRDYASRPDPAGFRRTLSFDFLRRPLGFNGATRVESVTLELCRLEGDAGHQWAAPTGSLQKLDCGLALVAAGHLARPIPGLPFDSTRGVIPTQDQRVVLDGQPCRGLYAVGWAKRGGHGLIGHNRRDAMTTVAALLADFS